MKFLFLAAVLAVSGLLYYTWTHRQPSAPNMPERYATGLQNDEKRAAEAAAKANAAVQQEVDSANKTLSEGEKDAARK